MRKVPSLLGSIPGVNDLISGAKLTSSKQINI